LDTDPFADDPMGIASTSAENQSPVREALRSVTPTLPKALKETVTAPSRHPWGPARSGQQFLPSTYKLPHVAIAG
jgi:hypothetical protein